MPNFLIYSPTRFPEVFNAVKESGETATDMPSIIALRTELDIDAVTALVREASVGENSLIVQAGHAQYQGDGRVASVGALLDRP